MKIILSRKGFDSSSGGHASPIMPDGTLLSLPIPSAEDDDVHNTYGSLAWNGLSFHEIIQSLCPRTKIFSGQHCHLDPDIRENVRPRPQGWQPAFGQMDAALSLLRNENVTVGDLFLFFGWFRQTEWANGKLQFAKNAPDLHIIYGYLQVGCVIEQESDIPVALVEHPHTEYHEAWKKGHNTIFMPSERLSFNDSLPGYGVLDYRKDRVLTKDGMSRRCWNMPDFFKEVSISYNRDPWKDGYFQSAGRGQEFVMEATPQILDWAKKIIE